jgi:hypothetical protein
MIERISSLGSDGSGVFMGIFEVKIFQRMDSTSFGPELLSSLIKK